MVTKTISRHITADSAELPTPLPLQSTYIPNLDGSSFQTLHGKRRAAEKAWIMPVSEVRGNAFLKPKGSPQA